MICALVNVKTKMVENMIVADPAVDSAPEGYVLIPAPKDFPFEDEESFDGQKLMRKEKPVPIKVVPTDDVEKL